MSGCTCKSITLFKGEDGRTIYNGTGVPTLATANVGDFYIDTDTYFIYGPYTGTSWGAGTSLIGATGANGTNGTNGATGAQGNYGGFSSEWNFDSNTGSASGTGEIRFNNATLASVTELYINNTNADATNLIAFLDSFDNSGSFGTIRVSKKSDSNVFWMGTVTAESDSGSEHAVTVTHIASNGTFTDTDPLVVSFVERGIVGPVAPTLYTKYVALMNQADVIAPTVAVLENTIGTITWTRSGVGTYLGTSVGLFDTVKTVCLMSASNFASNPASIVTITCINANDIRIKTYTAAGVLADDLLDGSVGLEIKRYL